MKGQTRTHGALTVRQFPCLADNYGFLVRDEASGAVLCIDTPEADEIVAQADALGWRITHVLNTHWHPDHTGGNAAVKGRYGCEVLGPKGEAERIPEHTGLVEGGDKLRFGDTVADVLDVGGHTSAHVAFWFADAGVCFVGDTVFSLGCGRLFEGSPQQMWASLGRVRGLPPETVLYCAHEYTAANAAFAVSVDPDNAALAERQAEVAKLREAGAPTVPMRLADELPVNPFLRADDPGLAANVGLAGAPPAEVFAEVRRRKDAF